jgi:hypothetical protein
MLEGYTPTRTERALIDRAFAQIAEKHARSYWELEHWAKQEQKGYGNRYDRVPAVAARALCVKWFADGVAHPDALLRDTFSLRPAAVYLQGLGARAAAEGKVDPVTARLAADAISAHENAFDRMMEKDRAA